jgi:hypothetical protein
LLPLSANLRIVIFTPYPRVGQGLGKVVSLGVSA